MAQAHEEDFVALLFQIIVTDKLTVEHQYLAAVIGLPGAADHPLLRGLATVDEIKPELDQPGFMSIRESVLEGKHPSSLVVEPH